jgi:hypothetical protein
LAALSKKIADHPGAVLKLGYVRRRIISIGTDYITAKKHRRCEDHSIRVKPDRVSTIVIDSDDVHTASPARSVGISSAAASPT